MALKKTLAQKIADVEARLAKLKATQAERLLDKQSPGMDKLLAAVVSVCEQNKCKPFDVIKALNRIKKTGLKLERPPRKAKEPKLKSKKATPAKKPE